MTPDRWQEIQALFLATADLAPDEQVAFLAAACPDDPSLRDEVVALLVAERHAADAVFITGVVAAEARALAGDDGDSRIGERVGPYRLVRELGRGGMGAVYLAERVDKQYHAAVAIKLVRHTLAAPELARRLRAERQILADLTHPNIAWLLDGGTASDGTPYIVMEYVDGEAVDAWCDHRGLGITARLALFRQVCAAVQYAHQALVVHRDLKPSNILVTTDGTPKLVDFGIAKLLAGADADVTGTLRLMTPAYAAPEQARGGRITVAADVYALGGVLYRLLAGRAPIDVAGATPGEIERRICEVEPAPPSAVARDAATRRVLRGDLDTIVLKALAKEPARRYASVEQLAEDLRRLADGQPVTARPASWRYRAGKFARRHRAGLAVAAAGLFVVASLTTFYTLRLAGERDRAQASAVRADRVAEFLKTVFVETSPDGSPGGRMLTAPELLDRGAARIRTELASEPETQAALMRVIGQAYRGLGFYDKADSQLTGAIAAWRRSRAPDDRGLADILFTLSVVRRVAGDYVAADTLAYQAVEMRRRLFATESLEFANVLNALAEARRYRGDYASADTLYRESLGIRRRLLPAGHRDIADNLNNLALLLHARGDYAGAEVMHREALSVRLRLSPAGEHYEVSNSLSNLALVLTAQAKYAEAESLLIDALARRRSMFGPDEPRTVFTHASYGALLLAMGRHAEAQTTLENALRLMRRRLAPDHPTVADALATLALVLSARGERDSARVTAARAHAALLTRRGPAHRTTLESVRTMGLVAAAAGERAAAESLLAAAYDGLRAQLGSEHPSTRRAAADLAALTPRARP